jgi:hypothetical protein
LWSTTSKKQQIGLKAIPWHDENDERYIVTQIKGGKEAFPQAFSNLDWDF